MGMYEGKVEPSLLNGSEVWGLNVHERKRIEAVEMNCLRNICGVRRIDRVRNEEIRRRCRKKGSASERIDQSVLRWFGHIERMEDNKLAREVYELEMQEPRCRGRSCKG